MKVKVKSVCQVRPCNPWAVAYQAPPSTGFSRQEHWSGLPFPSPGDLPDSGIEPMDRTQVSRIEGRRFNLWATRKSVAIKSCYNELRIHGSLTMRKFSSTAQSCPTLCDPIDFRTTDFPVHLQLPELAQTHVCWVGNATQPSHPLSSPSPPAFSFSQLQGLF